MTEFNAVQNRPQAPAPDRSGFTMIELMVAIAITSILILFISQVFNTVQSTVSYGIRVADVLDHQRVISEQLVRDMSEMLGPGDDGFLILVNHAVPAYYSADHEQGSKEAKINKPPYIRSDQLVFVRSRGDLEPLCPDTDKGFAGQSSAQFVRVWYGHGIRPRPDGLLTGAGPNITPPPTAGARGAINANPRYTVGGRLTDNSISSAQYGNLGGRDTGNGAPAVGLNQYAANWILARQALFLDPTKPANQTAVRAADANSNARVSVAGTPQGLTRQLWEGLTDIASISLKELHHERLFYQYYTGATSGTAGSGYLNFAGAAHLAFGDHRLIVNPDLHSIWRGNTPDVAPWQVAQQHGLLMPNVSELAIDFAADVNENDMIDYVDEKKVQDFIKDPKTLQSISRTEFRANWLIDKGFNVTQLNAQKSNTDVRDADLDKRYQNSRICWYSYYASNSPVTFGPVIDPSTNQRSLATFGNVNGSDRWPPYMDLRTTTNTDLRPLKDSKPNISGMFVWHKNDPRKWPLMLRFRYRLHDSAGQLSDSSGEPGRSFEQIIRVRR